MNHVCVQILYEPATMATTRRERKTPVSERKISHTTSDGIRILTLVWFQEFAELLEGNYVSRSFPKIYTRSDLYGPTTMATMRRERKTPDSE